MKHAFAFLIGLSAALALISCESLHIAINTQTPEGQRNVLTSNLKLCPFNGGSMMVALGARLQQKDTVAAVLVTCDANSDHGIFDKNDRILIRLADSTVITLTNVYDKEYESSTETRTDETAYIQPSYGYAYVYSPWGNGIVLAPRDVVTIVPHVYSVQTTNSYALYLINYEQLLGIMNGPVVKFRIEVEDQDVDLPYPANVSSIFTRLFECLKEGVNKEIRKPDF